MKLQHLELANKALKNLIIVIKTKYRSKLNVEKEMRIAISKLEPRFEFIMEHKQAHPSH